MQQPQQLQDQARSQAQTAEATNDPRCYAANIKRMLGDVQTHARGDTRRGRPASPCPIRDHGRGAGRTDQGVRGLRAAKTKNLCLQVNHMGN